MYFNTCSQFASDLYIKQFHVLHTYIIFSGTCISLFIAFYPWFQTTGALSDICVLSTFYVNLVQTISFPKCVHLFFKEHLYNLNYPSRPLYFHRNRNNDWRFIVKCIKINVIPCDAASTCLSL